MGMTTTQKVLTALKRQDESGMILEAMTDNKDLYFLRKEYGLCVRCGTELTDQDRTRKRGMRCKSCRSIQVSTARDRTAERRKRAGLCVVCGRILIGRHRADSICEDCTAKRRERADDESKSDYKAMKESAAKFEEAAMWLKRTVRGIATDTMHAACVDCPWMRRRTQLELRSYCPSASGTGPEKKDCLRYICAGSSKRKRRPKEVQDELCESDREPGAGS